MITYFLNWRNNVTPKIIDTAQTRYTSIIFISSSCATTSVICIIATGKTCLCCKPFLDLIAFYNLKDYERHGENTEEYQNERNGRNQNIHFMHLSYTVIPTIFFFGSNSTLTTSPIFSISFSTGSLKLSKTLR